MTVAAVLSDKGHEIVTASPDRKVSEICEMLVANRIGAIMLIGADDRIEGIISERDIVRAIARDGIAALDQASSEHMTTGVVSCTEHETVNEVMERMTQGRFRHLPVMDEGRLVGIISIGDVVKHRIAQAEREAAEMRSYITTV